MAKIENTPYKNQWGDGYKQKVTLNNGEKYIIENTPYKNQFGDGYKQQIRKTEDWSGLGLIGTLVMIGIGLAGIVILALLFNLLCVLPSLI